MDPMIEAFAKDIPRRPDETTEDLLSRLHGPGAVVELRKAASKDAFSRLIERIHHTDDLSPEELFEKGYKAGIEYASSKMTPTGS